MSNKRKLENSTFGPKIYIFQHDLFSLSAFFTELHRIANCLLEGFKLAKLISELDSLFREQNDQEKFVDLCNAYPEAFSTFYSCSLRKITGSNISYLN